MTTGNTERRTAPERIGLTAARADAPPRLKLTASSDAFGATERRLYALPVIRARIEDCREELAELENCGIEALRQCSASLVRLIRPGVRLTPEEVHEAQIAELRARLAADEREERRMRVALNMIARDHYYSAVEGKYFNGETDREVADKLHCDPATVRRNRAKLVRVLALRLYGAEAL